MRVLSLVVLMGLALPIAASADSGQVQKARFEVWLKEIRAPLSSSDANEAADRLIESSARSAAFQLQALGKLYGKHKRFESLRGKFKEIEDAIGEYEKWANVLARATKKGASPDALARLQKKKETAQSKLVRFLQSEKWVVSQGSSRLDKIDDLLADFEWDDYETDRRKMLKGLIKQLSKIDETEFDLSWLEKGNGLHELRRELRWFMIESSALNGLIQFRPDSSDCPIQEFSSLIGSPAATRMYAELPTLAAEPRPCLISQCLFVAIADSVHQLGKLKDKTETKNYTSGKSDAVPPKTKAKATEIYNRIRSTRLLPTLKDQLKTCRED